MIHKYLTKQNTELLKLSVVIDEITRDIDNQDSHIKLAHMAFVELLESYKYNTMDDTMSVGDFKTIWYSIIFDLMGESSNEHLPLSDRFMNVPNKVWVN